MRDSLKKLAGRALCSLLPQGSYDRNILVLSHMRSASTAVSNVLCSHECVSGYGETHVSHDSPDAPGRLALNLALRRALSLRSRFLLDKILHNDLDEEPPGDFRAASALFLVRAPGETIPSIQNLATVDGMPEWQDPENAATYYAERLDRLAELWFAFPPDQRLGMTSEEVLADPDGALTRISEWLGLDPPLSNSYVSHPASTQGGGGDPLDSGDLDRIEKRELAPPPPLDMDGLPDALSRRCLAAHARLVGLFRNAA